MTTSFATRFAGKVLGDFLKSASGAVSGAAEQATKNYLMSQVGAPGLIGKLATRPETVSKIVGTAAPVAATGAVIGGAKLLGLGKDSERGKSFATQQYQPGLSPLTNAHAAAMLVEQQRFQQQLQLIRAREMAHAGSGSLGSSLTAGNSAGMLQGIFSATPSY